MGQTQAMLFFLEHGCNLGSAASQVLRPLQFLNTGQSQDGVGLASQNVLQIRYSGERKRKREKRMGMWRDSGKKSKKDTEIQRDSKNFKQIGQNEPELLFCAVKKRNNKFSGNE